MGSPRMVLWVAVAGAYVLSGCGVTNRASIVASAGMAQSTADDAGTQAELGALANNQFGMRLLQELSERKCKCVGNQLIAPFSISNTLAMLAAGGKQNTASQMTAVLGYAGGVEAMNAGVGSLRGVLASYVAPGPVLLTANRIWSKAGVPVLAAYQATLKADYGADTGAILSDPEPAREAINAWVAQQTHGTIPELLSAGIDVTQSPLILTNALYLNAAWAHPFDSSETVDGPFTTAAGSRTVSMMHQGMPFKYAETAALSMLELPYAKGHLVMDIALPVKPDATGLWPNSDLASTFQDALSQLTLRQVEATIPGFAVRAPADLSQGLEQLGMTDAFSARADFSGITGQVGYNLGAVVHQAFISVTERGTEAGASTAGLVYTSAPDGGIVQFTADRPFVYVIRDTQTGAYLFVGFYKGPEAAS